MIICIRKTGEQKCVGHECVACGRLFFCNADKHMCPPGRDKTRGYEPGIIRVPMYGERLAYALEMLRLPDPAI